MNSTTNTTKTPAFVALGATAVSSFTSSTALKAATVSPLTANRSARTAAGRRRLSIVAQTQYNEPQPGDAGYKPPPPVPKGTGMQKTEPVKAEEPEPSKDESDVPKKVAQKGKGGRKLPVVGKISADAARRGLGLLKDDLLKSAPQRLGVGRQDKTAIMKPMYGEPGYKPAAYETVKVSDLGISPFPDDANAVGNVGGISAVKKAAVEVKKGEKTAKEIKKAVLNIKTEKKEEVFDIPDYLKPLPEDTTRKGYTWKNYNGR